LAEVYSFQSPFAYAANNPIYYNDYLGMGPREWFKNFKTWFGNTFLGHVNGIPTVKAQSEDTGNSGGGIDQSPHCVGCVDLTPVVVEANRIIQPIADHEPIQGPEFSGDIWDWLNKINNTGNRHWVHTETGVTYIIDDHGNIVRLAPTTGIAPNPGGKGKQTFIKGLEFVKNNILHHSIKPNILKAVGKRNFANVVGKNPNVTVKNGKIILQGTGANSGKVYKTGLDASKFFGN